jgi:hypothetical protein
MAERLSLSIGRDDKNVAMPLRVLFRTRTILNLSHFGTAVAIDGDDITFCFLL